MELGGDGTNMNFGDCLIEFVQVLSESDNSDLSSQKAFGMIAGRYHIGKILMHFVAPSSVYTRGGDHKEYVMFEREADIEDESRYHRQFHTGEGGTVDYFLHCVKGTEVYSEEAVRELDTIFEILFFHCGRWRLINHVKKLSLTDSLTGLPNSGGFLAYANELLQKKEIAKYCAFYLNLSCFSLVNKRFGSDETDTIIQRYSQELVKFLVGDECVGRLGGDNFVALILKERTYEFLNYISEIETYGMLGGKKTPVKVHAVAGVYEIDENIEHCGMVIGECATALDIARHVVKKPYVFATDEIRLQMYKERQVASSFPEAIRKGLFKAYYQPKVETDTYRIVGAEALARMECDGKLIAPIEFVPALERNGMICTLDFYILEQVCKDIRQWLKMGMEPVRISVNLSRKHLANPNLAEDILNILGKYEMESKYIELELTETVEESETNQIIEFMKKMKKHQVALSIDDFGTGYSSLNLLRFFPVDVLKLDRTFLNNIEENDRIVLSNIIRMACELHMDVVAEGVENWEQVKYLKGMDCNVVQGFLFDKPLPKAVFEEKMKTGKYDMEPIHT
ncbi:MAG: EAL domain-containing protein [Wujia sp.]